MKNGQRRISDAHLLFIYFGRFSYHAFRAAWGWTHIYLDVSTIYCIWIFVCFVCNCKHINGFISKASLLIKCAVTWFDSKHQIVRWNLKYVIILEPKLTLTIFPSFNCCYYFRVIFRCVIGVINETYFSNFFKYTYCNTIKYCLCRIDIFSNIHFEV